MTKSVVSKCIFIFFVHYIFKYATSLEFGYPSITINLPQGKLVGSYNLFKNQRRFLGIPYASVTSRFEEPGSPPSWNGTLNAVNGNIRCNQYLSSFNIPIGQEDCLVLNVYTPANLEVKIFPVMVFIHGGGFYWGSNTDLIYNPKYFVKENVIVVTVNYRLGAFGFLCLGLNEAPGNIGLKDQLAALKWIQNNIAHFQGDPSSVTLFGESAGAISVNYMLFSNSAKGLFHRAIMQSGSILMPQAFSYHPVESASMVALKLGYNTNDPKELLNIFKNSTANDIVKASYMSPKNNLFAPYVFKPCIETAITRGKPFLTTPPTELLQSNSLNIPVITGFNDKEGIYWATNYDSQTHEKLRENLYAIIPNYLRFENFYDVQTFVDDLVKVYLANKTVINGFIDYLTDSLIAYPVTVASEGFTRNANRTVYNYYFKYDSTRNLNKFLTHLRTTPGACHGDELFYMFEPIIYSVLPTTANDAAVINTLTHLWTSFAKTGQPSGAKIPWSRSGEPLMFLEINTDNKMTNLPNVERMDFWRKAFEKHGRK